MQGSAAGNIIVSGPISIFEAIPQNARPPTRTTPSAGLMRRQRQSWWDSTHAAVASRISLRPTRRASPASDYCRNWPRGRCQTEGMLRSPKMQTRCVPRYTSCYVRPNNPAGTKQFLTSAEISVFLRRN